MVKRLEPGASPGSHVSGFDTRGQLRLGWEVCSSVWIRAKSCFECLCGGFWFWNFAQMVETAGLDCVVPVRRWTWVLDDAGLLFSFGGVKSSRAKHPVCFGMALSLDTLRPSDRVEWKKQEHNQFKILVWGMVLTQLESRPAPKLFADHERTMTSWRGWMMRCQTAIRALDLKRYFAKLGKESSVPEILSLNHHKTVHQSVSWNHTQKLGFLTKLCHWLFKKMTSLLPGLRLTSSPCGVTSDGVGTRRLKTSPAEFVWKRWSGDASWRGAWEEIKKMSRSLLIRQFFSSDWQQCSNSFKMF